MGTALQQFGLQTAGQIIGGGMGLILGGVNDRRQLRQQEKLQELQIKGNKEMGDYNYMRQKQMWEETSYAAQKEQMEKAGLNPALMYGMGGGGGATTGTGGQGVSGGQAPSGGGEAQAMSGMGMQMAQQAAITAAQTELIKAQTEKTKAETTKTAGVDTTEAATRIDSLLQGIDNARQQHQIQKLEITLKNIENFEKQASQEDRLDYIEYQTKIALKQLGIITNDETISSATKKDKIKIVQQEAIGAALRNILTSAQTDKTKSDIMVNSSQMSQITNNIMLNWDKLSNDNKALLIQKELKDWMTDPNREAINQAINSLNGIMGLFKKGTTIFNHHEHYDQ